MKNDIIKKANELAAETHIIEKEEPTYSASGNAEFE